MTAAYGLYDPKKVILYPRNKLPKSIIVGQTISITSKTNVVRTYKVLQLMDTLVSLDSNHPLAEQGAH
jgi:FKBP-type peptidyl-prolyl cis-trans isomerase SlyD